MFSQEPLLKATIKDFGTDGTRIVDFEYDGVFMERLEEIRDVPLPPYIERSSDSEDRDRYQTVCREEGSVAAPAAGSSFYRGAAEEGGRQGCGARLCDSACRDRHVQAC